MARAITISAVPATVNLILYRGDVFSKKFVFNDASDDPQPVDISGWDILSEIREKLKSEDPTVTFTVTVTGDDSNELNIMLTPEDTALLVRNTYVWDLQVTISTAVYTLFAGSVTMEGDVSRV